MKGKIKNMLWLSLIAVMIAATLPIGGVQATDAVVYVDPGLIETSDTRFHYPVVGETVGVGDGFTTVFSLANPSLDYESETVYVDGVPQTRDVDYTIVDSTGVITFLYVPSDSAEITADYSYWSDVFYVDINVANATDLWTTGFKVDYSPFGKTLIAAEVTKGGFLDQDGYNTHFVKTIDVLTGTVNVGYTRLPTFLKPNVGANGDGTLATIKFKIVSAGNSPLNLVDVDLLDSNGAALLHQTVDGAYYGPTAALVMGNVGKRGKKVGDTQYFGTRIENLASVPMEVRTHWDMYRVEDSQRFQIYSGQIYTGFGPIDYEYLYVNEYNPWLEWDWINPGTSVFGPPDGNYAESTIDAAMTSTYGFEDIVLGDRLIGNVVLEGYTQYPNGATENIDIDMYTVDPVTFSWLGSLYGTETWDWVGVRWMDDSVSDVVPATLYEEGLNSLSVLIYNYDPGLTGDPIRVDSLRVKVEFSKFNPVFPESFVVQPGENLELPEAYWTLNDYDVGKWITTLVCEYRYAWTDQDGYHATAWIQSEKVRTFTWWVNES
jgi:hypothetical protein